MASRGSRAGVALGLGLILLAGFAFACICSPEYKAATHSCCAPATGTVLHATPSTSCCKLTASPTYVESEGTSLLAPARARVAFREAAAASDPTTLPLRTLPPRSAGPPTILRI
jgi:hypothetical protein